MKRPLRACRCCSKVMTINYASPTPRPLINETFVNKPLMFRRQITGSFHFFFTKRCWNLNMQNQWMKLHYGFLSARSNFEVKLWRFLEIFEIQFSNFFIVKISSISRLKVWNCTNCGSFLKDDCIYCLSNKLRVWLLNNQIFYWISFWKLRLEWMSHDLRNGTLVKCLKKLFCSKCPSVIAIIKG